MNNKNIKYLYNEEYGSATCIIKYKNQIFTGVAFCHPDDEDMKNRLTGTTIAEARAKLHLLRYIKQNEIKPQLDTLIHFHSCISRSQKYCANSYENKMLMKSIARLKKEYNNISTEIKELYNNLGQYINNKECVFQAIRKFKVKNN